MIFMIQILNFLRSLYFSQYVSIWTTVLYNNLKQSTTYGLACFIKIGQVFAFQAGICFVCLSGWHTTFKDHLKKPLWCPPLFCREHSLHCHLGMPTPTHTLLLERCHVASLGLISAKPAAVLIVPSETIVDVREGLDLGLQSIVVVWIKI